MKQRMNSYRQLGNGTTLFGSLKQENQQLRLKLKQVEIEIESANKKLEILAKYFKSQ